MAVRLQMKLGLVPEADRLPDSPDQMVVVEPSVGSVARSKGALYLLVTARAAGNRIEEAARTVADTIRTEYYYDESAGIRVCIRKAIQLANKKLVHQRERLGMAGSDGDGPIGIGVAVVRGNELYVATVGPAEAYLIRQARLSTLPDPHRERGLPTAELEPEIWRGEISVGDSLVLVVGERRRADRAGRAQGRDGDAPSAVGDGAPPPPLRARATAPGPTGRSRSRRPRSPRHRSSARLCRSSRRSRSPAPRALADPARRRGDRRRRRGPGGRRARAEAAGSARSAGSSDAYRTCCRGGGRRIDG